MLQRNMCKSTKKTLSTITFYQNSHDSANIFVAMLQAGPQAQLEHLFGENMQIKMGLSAACPQNVMIMMLTQPCSSHYTTSANSSVLS